MIMNRDAGAMRSLSPTGLRPMGHPTQTTVDDEGVVNMPRVNPAVAAETLRRVMVQEPAHCDDGSASELGGAR
jgi:hypothetical protein